MAKVECEDLSHISMHVHVVPAHNIICWDGSALNALRTLQIKVESVVGDDITINYHSRWTIHTFSNLKLSILACESSAMSFIAGDVGQFWSEIKFYVMTARFYNNSLEIRFDANACSLNEIEFKGRHFFLLSIRYTRSKHDNGFRLRVIIHDVEFLQSLRHHVLQIGGNNGISGNVGHKSVLCGILIDGTSKSGNGWSDSAMYISLGT